MPFDKKSEARVKRVQVLEITHFFKGRIVESEIEEIGEDFGELTTKKEVK